MDKILHDPKDPKLWELWYIPYNGQCRILSINRITQAFLLLLVRSLRLLRLRDTLEVSGSQLKPTTTKTRLNPNPPIQHRGLNNQNKGFFGV